MAPRSGLAYHRPPSLVHLVAPFRILRAASAWLRGAAKREAAEGRRVMRKVVNITSVAGIDGGPGQAAYSSAKAGVLGLTPEEAANAVLFFCSPLSDYVTGEVLLCGGGLHF